MEREVVQSLMRFGLEYKSESGDVCCEHHQQPSGHLNCNQIGNFSLIFNQLPHSLNQSCICKKIDNMRFTIASIIALATTVSAVANAVVKNSSPSTFYVWSVGSSVGERHTVAPGQSNPHPLASLNQD